MGHSYHHNSYHIIFATKFREDLLALPLQERLYPYLAAMINQKFGLCRIINGTEDHIHILCDIAPKHSLSDVICQLKSETSKWLNRTGLLKTHFSWQEGFGCFSVSKSQLAVVNRYIQNQKIHHAHISFQEEYQQFLIRHELPFDE